ncbi:U-box domain-containing protein 38 [Linum grandiflorum]
MGGNGKPRWKISFHHHRPKPSSQPPSEFICPISGTLMYDPVVVSSGQTFERVSVQVCLDLGFVPALEDNSFPDLTAVISNTAFKKTILNWCDKSGAPHPQPPDYVSVEKIMRAKMAEQSSASSSVESENPDLRVSERELLKAVAENPPVLFYSHAATEVSPRVNHFYSNSSDESVIVDGGGGGGGAASPLTPLPLATKPACYSSPPTSSNNSSEIATEFETLTLIQTPSSTNSDSGFSTPEEAEIVAKLKSPEVHEQEQGVISLRKLTRTRDEIRGSICTPRLLSALRSAITSRYSILQTNAMASLVNLSLEKPNKVKIVRSGFVPLLIDLLKGGSSESQEHAAGALFSLALEDENKMAIGVLGALQPLMYALRSESERTRMDSALALYHLTLIQSNRVKLVKLGAVPTLLSLVKLSGLSSRLLLVLCNLAVCGEGRSAMLDGNAVAILVGMLREGEGGGVGDAEAAGVRENCVAALYSLSQGSLRFKGLAKEARAGEVLRQVEEGGSERGREKARRIMQMMKGRGDDDGEESEVDWDEILESGGLSRSRYRGNPAAKVQAPNSSEF